MSEIPPQVQSYRQKAQEKLDADSALREALATPNPGPLKDAFAPQQFIPVGKYLVRPFYDLDFDILQALDNPLARMDGKTELKIMELRGQKAWELCWIFTHTIDEAEEAFTSGKLKELAKKEFSRLHLGPIIEIYKAVIEQFGRNFSTVVGLEAATEQETGQKKTEVPPVTD